jgi:phenylalanyl-tRNA synthetase beta chain
MNVSLEWLNSLLDRPIDADEADQALTDVGFPIEGRDEQADDVMLDVEVTSNRPDVLCHIGVARELAAATGRSLSLPQITLDETGQPLEQLTRVDNQANDLCPLYTARLIQGVKVRPSPNWLARRIEAIGLRPINNIVDITNYVMYEMGQPLHAFDFALLDDQRIVVRRARDGEAFEAIDHTRHKLNADMLVIADGKKPVAVAGVMGGVDSEVNSDTVDVLLEAAEFDPLNIRTTSRALKLASDSSYRFERGVDPAGVERSSRRAAQLMCELAGGTLCAGVISAGRQPGQPRSLTLRPERANRLLGYDLPAERMIEYLKALDLQAWADGGAIHCTVPTFRLDLEREVDLIEEIGRLHRFDQIEIRDAMHLQIRPPQPEVRVRREISQVLIAGGYCQTVTFSNVPVAHGQPFLAPDATPVMLSEEQKKAEPMLRPSLLPSLLAVRKANQDAGNNDIRLFELAHAFWAAQGDYREKRQLAMLSDAPDPTDAMRRMRGVLETLLRITGRSENTHIVPDEHKPGWAEHAAALTDGDQVIGTYGLATQKLLKLFDLNTPVLLCELDYEALTEHYPPARTVHALPRFPGIERDLSVVVDEPTPWSQIARTIEQAKPDLMESVDFVGVYRGKQVGKGRKSVTLRMSFRDPSRTLRHDEVDGQVESVVSALSEQVNAELRSS